METSRMVINYVLSCTLMSGAVYTVIYFYLKSQILLKYVIYLLACFANFLVLSVYFDEITGNDSSIAAIVYNIFFLIQVMCYFMLIGNSFNLTRKTNYRLWFSFQIAYAVVIVQIILISIIRYYSNLQSTAYLVTVIVANLYPMPFTLYGMYYFARLKNDSFRRLILYGAISSFCFIYASAIYQAVDTGNHQLNTARGLAMLGTGIFIEIIFFSVAMALDFKKRFEEQITSIKNIEYLNLVSQAQIAELEENTSRIRTDEQKRLGRELHDNLANRLASINAGMQLEIVKLKETEIAPRLSLINKQVKDTYLLVRERSHELYKAPYFMDVGSFSKRVIAIADTALSSELYKKHIIIEDNAIAKLGLDVKINILRIIQEAITNILKHAHAKTISILLFEESGTVTLQITDDGKGFNINAMDNSKSVGLHSIAERAAEIKGKFTIENSGGTKLVITIPRVD